MSRTLVTLHGLFGSPSLFDPLAAKLRSHRVVGLTLPGHGKPFTTPEDFARTAHDLAAQIRQLGNEVDLVGYSLGARLALSLLAHHPALIRRAVLISVNPGLKSEHDRTARRAQDEAHAAAAERDFDAFVTTWEQNPLFSSQARLAPHIMAAQRSTRLSHTSAGIAASLRTHGLGNMPDYSDVVVHQTGRIALLVGELDAKFSSLAQALRAHTPSLAVETIPAAGHNPLLEEPVTTAARIEALLADEPAIPRPLPSPTPQHIWNAKEGEP